MSALDLRDFPIKALASWDCPSMPPEFQEQDSTWRYFAGLRLSREGGKHVGKGIL